MPQISSFNFQDVWLNALVGRPGNKHLSSSRG
jgi:hypothetical protein